MEAPLAAADIFATIGLHDRPALAAAMSAFFVAHQGMGPGARYYRWLWAAPP